MMEGRPKQGRWPFIAAAIRHHSGPVLLVLAVVAAGHVWAIGDGIFFDDHWHQVQLREKGWGWNDLIESATFDLPGELMQIWWQTEPLQWRYARPVSMFFQKLEWRASDSLPWAVSAAGVGWHALCAALVYALAVQVFARRDWALFAAIFFALNPHSAFAASCAATRNALISSALILLSILFYVRGSGLRLNAQEADSIRTNDRGSQAWRVAAIVIWVVAMFAREVAVVVPVLLVGLDWAFGGPGHCRRRWRIYGVMTVLLGGFLFWRLVVFPTGPVPSFYFNRPQGFADLIWLFGKLLHQLLCVTVLTPMFAGPFSTNDVPVSWTLLVVMAVPVLAIGALYGLAGRPMGRRAWFWPAFVVITLIPVVPVFTMPHFGHLPFAGYAVMVGVILSAMPRRRRRLATSVVLGLMTWSFGLNRLAWRGVCRTEQLLTADAAESAPPVSVRDVFFLDLPIVNLYAMLPLRDAWDRPELTGHVLTFAPDTLAMRHASVVTQLDAHRLQVELRDPAYFSSLSGRLLVNGLRPGQPLQEGDVIRGPQFDVTIDQTRDVGVQRMTFAFHDRLDSEKVWFFRSSVLRPAQRMLFRGEDGPFPWQVPTPTADEPAQREWAARHADALTQSRWYYSIMDTLGRIVRSDLLLTGTSGGS